MKEWQSLSKARLETFTDALIAIIMTILVLDIKIDAPDSAVGAEIAEELVHQLPHFVGFILSFSVIAVLWFSHNDLLRMVKVTDRKLAALNFLFVGSISTIPFSTALASKFPHQSIAVATLAGNMLLMNLFLTVLFIYAQKRLPLDTQYQTPRRIEVKRMLGIGGMFIFLIATVISFVSPATSLILCALVPTLHMIPVQE